MLQVHFVRGPIDFVYGFANSTPTLKSVTALKDYALSKNYLFVAFYTLLFCIIYKITSVSGKQFNFGCYKNTNIQ